MWLLSKTWKIRYVATIKTNAGVRITCVSGYVLMQYAHQMDKKMEGELLQVML